MSDTQTSSSDLYFPPLQHPICHRIECQTRNGFDADLAGDVFSVGDDGMDGDVERIRNLFVGQPLRYGDQYLLLAKRKVAALCFVGMVGDLGIPNFFDNGRCVVLQLDDGFELFHYLGRFVMGMKGDDN